MSRDDDGSGSGGAMPPRLAEAILVALLPAQKREGLLGDLHELYVVRLRTDGLGAARRWYRLQVAGLCVRLTVGRLIGALASISPGGLARQTRLAARSLARSPAFSAPALLILAVGMTAATAVFTIVDSIAFRPLDLPESHRLVIVCEDHQRLSGACIASPGNTEDFRRSTSTLAELGIGRGWSFHLTDGAGTTGVAGGLATAGFLRALGVEPVVGRLFTDREHGPDDDKVVLLSHALWTSRYGADPSVVGTAVELSGETHTIVGVLPEGFEAPFDLWWIQLWKPPHFDPLDPEVRGWRGFRAIGRLADGASVAAASAELTGVYAGIAERHEEVDEEWRLRVEPLLDVVVGDARPVLMAFLGAAALLLLIVCANVANLVLVRGLGRRQELAVRAALGASRGRLAGGIFLESLLLSALAAALALVLAGGATGLVLRLAPAGIPRLDEVGMDGRVFAFAALASLAATATFALLPALRVTSWNLSQGLRDGARAGEGRASKRMQSGLLVAELALSLVLLSGAGLLARSFQQYLAWEPGFDRGSLLAVSAFVDQAEYPNRAAFMSFFRQAEERLAGLPGVTSVATASAGPLFGGGDGATSFLTEGADPGAQPPNVRWYDVGPGYFRTLGLPVVRGREVSEDDAPGAEPVAVVNETMARLAWGDADPLGRLVRLPELELELRVVGVVADVPPITPGARTYPEIYWSNRQLGRPATFVLVRTEGDAAALAGPVRAALLEADPDLSLGTPYTLASSEARALVRPRFQAAVLVAFAMVALLLSVVGVYSVVSYAAARRLREMGIRLALGAAREDVTALMMRSMLAVSALGVAAGLAGALAVGRLMRGLVPGVSPTDPVALAGASLVLVLATAAATLPPARRASRVDPLQAIRVE